MSLVKALGIPVAGVGALAIAVGTVTYFEGRENTAYRDPVGVVTICDGHTSTARLGQTLSDEECDELLAGDLGAAFDAVDEHVEVALPPTRRAALASFVFNVGEGAFQRSTLLRRINAGQAQEACDELLRWVYAGGRDCRVRSNNCYGLVIRRQAEREICLMDEATYMAGQTDE